MGRCKRDWTINKFEHYIKEGRGQGQGESYKPWLTIQDFPSPGRSARCPGWKTKRLWNWSGSSTEHYERHWEASLALCECTSRKLFNFFIQFFQL